MDTPELLIADSNEDFCLALAQALGERYRVRCCGTGKDALDILRRERCDVLVLDLMLPEMDGITLLQTIVEEGICPMTLVVTRFINEYVLETLSQLGVGYLMRKPCEAAAAVTRILELRSCIHLPAPMHDPRVFVSGLLHSLGVATRHDGYTYLREAILLISGDPYQTATKELYPKVAAMFGCRGEQVERSIRNALIIAWKNRDERVWQQFFPTGNGRPTNMEFITCLAESLYLNRETGTVCQLIYRL